MVWSTCSNLDLLLVPFSAETFTELPPAIESTLSFSKVSQRVVDKIQTENEAVAASQRRLADLGMLAVAVIWGLNMPIMKFALGRVDPYLFNACRLLVSAIVLAAIVLWQQKSIINRSKDAPPVRRQIFSIAVFSFFAGFAYQLLFLAGMDRTSAGNTALIMCAIPMWTAILARLLINEKIQRLAWLGLAIALAGTMVVTLAVMPESRSSAPVIGNLIVAAAALCWSLGTVWSRPLMRQIDPLPLAFCGVAIAVPFHFLIIPSGISELGTFITDPWLGGALLYSGALSTGIAYMFWNQGIQILGTAHGAIYQNLVPIVALVAAWFLIGEIPVLLQLLGGFLIITGVLVMRQNRG